jgi:hypothetical protein
VTQSAVHEVTPSTGQFHVAVRREWGSAFALVDQKPHRHLQVLDPRRLVVASGDTAQHQHASHREDTAVAHPAEQLPRAAQAEQPVRS